MMSCTTASDNNMQWCFPTRKPTLRMLRRNDVVNTHDNNDIYTHINEFSPLGISSVLKVPDCTTGRWERMQSIA